jgi:pSer/pThr/pTyr-binding forkhead associated (FHA) protein
MKLVLSPCGDSRRAVTVGRCPFVIGRGRTADLVVDAASVSDPHACIVEYGGAYFLIDLSSKNGTYIVHPGSVPSPVPAALRPEGVRAGLCSPQNQLRSGAVIAVGDLFYECQMVGDACEGESVAEGLTNLGTEGPRLRMRIVRGSRRGQEVDVTVCPVMLGKEPGERGIVVGDEADLSRRHARITFVGGRFRIEDCDSKNGTFVNRRRVSAVRPTAVHDGDVVSLGTSVELVVCLTKVSHIEVVRILTLVLVALVAAAAVLVAMFVSGEGWGSGTRQGGRQARPASMGEPDVVSGPEAGMATDSVAPAVATGGNTTVAGVTGDVVNPGIRVLAEAKGLVEGSKWDRGILLKARSTLAPLTNDVLLAATAGVHIARIDARLLGMDHCEKAYDFFHAGLVTSARGVLLDARRVSPENPEIAEAEAAVAAHEVYTNGLALFVAGRRSAAPRMPAAVTNATQSGGVGGRWMGAVLELARRNAGAAVAGIAARAEAGWDRAEFEKALRALSSLTDDVVLAEEARTRAAAIEPRLRSVEKCDDAYGLFRTGGVMSAKQALARARDLAPGNPDVAVAERAVSGYEIYAARLSAAVSNQVWVVPRMPDAGRDRWSAASRDLTRAGTPGVMKRLVARVEECRKARDYLAALPIIRMGREMDPGHGRMVELETSLRPVAEDKLDQRLRDARLLESQRDLGDGAQQIYDEILRVCSPTDWTAEFYRKAKEGLRR